MSDGDPRLDRPSATVTAVEISRLARVGRAAVSNWRRRFPDFPAPVGGTDRAPLFAWSEIEAWLRAQGKLPELPRRELAWHELHTVRGELSDESLLVLIGCALLATRAPTAGQPDARLDTRLDALATLRAEPRPARLRAALPRGVELPEAALPDRVDDALLPSLSSLIDIATEEGAADVYEFCRARALDTAGRSTAVTPLETARLMARLAGVALAATRRASHTPATVLDPACGTGVMLLAARELAPESPCYGQDADVTLAGIAALRAALASPIDPLTRAAGGDALRADAFPELRADAVLCAPPIGERDWGYEELGYDPRWEFGMPPRGEPELAWAQHALARLAPNGVAALLMPPAVASRRSGQRIRTELLRRGALRAVIALPAGVGAQHGVPLHLWLFGRAGEAPAVGSAAAVLLVDAGSDTAPDDWQAALHEAWRAFLAPARGETAVFDALERPGFCRAVPAIDLIAENVDLTPARHVTQPEIGESALDALATQRSELMAALASTRDALALTEILPARSDWRLTSIDELSRAGAVRVLRGTARELAGAAAGDNVADPEPLRVLTINDLLAGTEPSGHLATDERFPDTEGVSDSTTERQHVELRVDDVVLPAIAQARLSRVADTRDAGALLGRGLYALRIEGDALDPWFLAGFLRAMANTRQASSTGTTSSRLDIKRLRLPILPRDTQRDYGERFRALAELRVVGQRVGALADALATGIGEGLAAGAFAPEPPGESNRTETAYPAT